MNDFLVVLIAYQDWQYTPENTQPPKGIVGKIVRSPTNFHNAQQCVLDFNECEVTDPTGFWAVALHIRDRPKLGDQVILKKADILAN